MTPAPPRDARMTEYPPEDGPPLDLPECCKAARAAGYQRGLEAGRDTRRAVLLLAVNKQAALLAEIAGLRKVCGEAKSQGHHHDYSKPLDVRWLCQRCHAAEHMRERDARRKAGA